MALAKMQKIHMAVHRTILDELMEKIQKLGCCHFIKLNLEGDRPEKEGALDAVKKQLRSLDDLLGDVRFVSRFSESYATEKESALSVMMGDIPEYSLKSLTEATSETEFTVITSTLRSLEKQLSDIRSQITRIHSTVMQLEPLHELTFPLELFSSGTNKVQGEMFTVRKNVAQVFADTIMEQADGYVECSPLLPGTKETEGTLAILYLKENQKNVHSAAQEYQAVRLDIPGHLRLTCAEELQKLHLQVQTLEKEEAQVLHEILEHANAAYKKSLLMHDFWNMRRARLEALCNGEDTEQIILTHFWIPQEALPLLDETIKPYSAFTEMLLCDPDEGEIPPTLLENAQWSASVEPLTLMYGTPIYGGVDPTPLIAPFFFLFFGMCLGDAGYGLLLAGVFGYFLTRKRMAKPTRQFFTIVATGGIAAVIFGSITNSWFGDSLDAFPFLSFLAPLKSLQLLNPINDPMTLLGISLALGVIQIFIALFVAMIELIKKGDYIGAFADQGGWIVFLSGLIAIGLTAGGILPENLTLPARFIAIGGAAILILTQGRASESIIGKLLSGIMSLYNITGYLGDVLSYSRLLALGLGSAAVGMVVNLLAGLVSSVPYVGVLLGILIFVIGHLFSLTLNLLGAFIHSLRLQYVEFLGKFLDSSGVDFLPLSQNPQHVRIVND